MILGNSDKIKELVALSKIADDPDNEWHDLKISLDNHSFGYLVSLEIYNSNIEFEIIKSVPVYYTGFMSRWFLFDSDEKRIDRALKYLAKTITKDLNKESKIINLRSKYENMIKGETLQSLSFTFDSENSIQCISGLAPYNLDDCNKRPRIDEDHYNDYNDASCLGLPSGY